MKFLIVFLLSLQVAFAARTFNGSSHYHTFSSTQTQPVTIACWFKPTSTTVTQIPVCIGHSGTSRGFYLIYRAGDAGKPLGAVILSDGGSGEGVFTPGPSTSVWTHITGVYASTTSRYCYMNGVAGSENTSSTSNPSTQVFEIGRLFNAAGYLNGAVADVGVWNVALTADEVAALAKGVSPLLIRPSALVHYAPLVREVIDLKGRVPSAGTSTATDDHPRVYR